MDRRLVGWLVGWIKSTWELRYIHLRFHCTKFDLQFCILLKSKPKFTRRKFCAKESKLDRYLPEKFFIKSIQVFHQWLNVSNNSMLTYIFAIPCLLLLLLLLFNPIQCNQKMRKELQQNEENCRDASKCV